MQPLMPLRFPPSTPCHTVPFHKISTALIPSTTSLQSHSRLPTHEDPDMVRIQEKTFSVPHPPPIHIQRDRQGYSPSPPTRTLLHTTHTRSRTRATLLLPRAATIVRPTTSHLRTVERRTAILSYPKSRHTRTTHSNPKLDSTIISSLRTRLNFPVKSPDSRRNTPAHPATPPSSARVDVLPAAPAQVVRVSTISVRVSTISVRVSKTLVRVTGR